MKRFFLLLLFLSSAKLFSQQAFPEWSEGIVWYQIFPERFSNGDTTNDPEPEKVFINSDSIPQNWKIREWTSNWFEQDEWEKKSGKKIRDHIYERRYGGDIQGIIDKLDYLKELGVGAIYLNPVFEASSLHKYDGSTYHHIDVNFGPDPQGDRILMKSEIPDDPNTWLWTEADKLFFKLVEEVHKREMKIIIDGVFNHTGTQFWAFRDIKENGGTSKYKDWFIVNSFDDPSTPENEFDYKGWWGTKSLPELNRTETDLSPGPKQYVFNSTLRWMDPNNDGDPSDGIDGWRLDVAREVPMGFWNDWNKHVKTINQKAIIVGELWGLSPDFVSGSGPFDALMNYNFAFAVNIFFIAKETAIPISDFVDMLKEVQNTYPSKNLNILQNLVDSHDTDRLSSIIKNPDRQFDRDANEDNPNYDPGKPSVEAYEMQKLILAFQMTYQGAPMIYYGDEIGMWGADDPHDRKPMIWEDLKYYDEKIDQSSGFKKGFGTFSVEQNTDLLGFYKKLIAVRNQNEILKKGSADFVFTNEEKKTFSFVRMLEGEYIIAVFNLGEESDSFEIPISDANPAFEELISKETGVASSGFLQISIRPKSFKVFKLSKN